MKFRNEDPLEWINKTKTMRNKPNKGVILSCLTCSQGGTRRQPNLSKILSLSVQQSPGDNGDPGRDGGGDGGAGGGGGGAVSRWNGSYHFPSFKQRGKCDVCTHMVDTSTIYSSNFKRKFSIHGHNVHLPAAQRNKVKWRTWPVILSILEAQLTSARGWQAQKSLPGL
jgi:hypothetical protein